MLITIPIYVHTYEGYGLKKELESYINEVEGVGLRKQLKTWINTDFIVSAKQNEYFDKFMELNIKGEGIRAIKKPDWKKILSLIQQQAVKI